MNDKKHLRTSVGPHVDRRSFLGGTVAGVAMAGVSIPSFATAADPTDASGIVIDGLDVSLLNEEFVGLLRKAGVRRARPERSRSFSARSPPTSSKSG